jgi:hypothetical protein
VQVAIIKTRQTNQQGMIQAVVLVPQMLQVVPKTTFLSKLTETQRNTTF